MFYPGAKASPAAPHSRGRTALQRKEHTVQLTKRRRLLAAAALGIGLAGPLAYGASASATAITSSNSTATADIVAGTLSFVSTPGNITFPSVTLTGTDQTTSKTLPLDIGDNTGSLAGWNVTATSTQFSDGTAGNTLSTSAVTVQAAPSDACDSGATCTLATEASSIVYPYTLPAGATAPTATKIFDAQANTGMGDQTVTPDYTLAIPADTAAGTYTSTWTFSLISGP
jgi:hypothetical protein